MRLPAAHRSLESFAAGCGLHREIAGYCAVSTRWPERFPAAKQVEALELMMKVRRGAAPGSKYNVIGLLITHCRLPTESGTIYTNGPPG